jgi:hypothetical protein
MDAAPQPPAVPASSPDSGPSAAEPGAASIVVLSLSTRTATIAVNGVEHRITIDIDHDAAIPGTAAASGVAVYLVDGPDGIDDADVNEKLTAFYEDEQRAEWS